MSLSRSSLLPGRQVLSDAGKLHLGVRSLAPRTDQGTSNSSQVLTMCQAPAYGFASRLTQGSHGFLLHFTFNDEVRDTLLNLQPLPAPLLF